VNAGTIKGKPEIIVNDPSQIKILFAQSSSVYDYQNKYFHNKNYSAQERIHLKCAFMLLGYDLICKSDEWDEKTDIAVRSFQSKNNLKEDGKVGPKTLSVLKDSILNKKNIYSKHKSFVYNVLSDIELRQNINNYKTKEKNISNH